MMALVGRVSFPSLYTQSHPEWVPLRWLRCQVCHRPLEPRDIAAGFSICDDCPIE
jgi:hypothetical protein